VTLPEKLLLDTNCLIYRLDDPGGRRGRWLDERVFRPAMAGQHQLAVSTVSLAELMVRPYAEGLPERAHALRRALESLPGLTLVPLISDIADAPARLRAATGLPLPDALVVATAASLGAAIVTNDRQLARADLRVPIIVLDDAINETP